MLAAAGGSERKKNDTTTPRKKCKFGKKKIWAHSGWSVFFSHAEVKIGVSTSQKKTEKCIYRFSLNRYYEKRTDRIAVFAAMVSLRQRTRN
jgi:hypothetical protein